MSNIEKAFLKVYEENLRKTKLDKRTISDMFRRQTELVMAIDKEEMPEQHAHEESILEIIKRVNSDTL